MVVPLVGTWIEICAVYSASIPAPVVPLVGTWIEIRYGGRWTISIYHVVPLVGTWIEIIQSWFYNLLSTVVPFVGTWIEIDSPLGVSVYSRGRPPCGDVD